MALTDDDIFEAIKDDDGGIGEFLRDWLEGDKDIRDISDQTGTITTGGGGGGGGSTVVARHNHSNAETGDNYLKPSTLDLLNLNSMPVADTTTGNASTSGHGLVVKAVAPAANVLNVVGIANTETAYTNKSIFDATNPAALGTAAPGTSLIAAHRDHVHSKTVVTPDIQDWDGWESLSVSTGTYASASTFTIAGDFTTYIKKGTRIKCTNTTTKYFVSATDSTYSAPNTTVTVFVNTDYVVANAAITALQFSYGNPPDYPGWFNWTIVFGGFSADPTVALATFFVTGKLCFFVVDMSADGTSNATTFTVSTPITSSSRPGASATGWGGAMNFARDNGAALTGASRWNLVGSATSFDLYTNMAAGAWTGSAGKRAYFEGFFEY